MNCKLMISGISLAALITLSCPTAWARQEGRDLKVLTGQIRTRTNGRDWVRGRASGLEAGDQVETGPGGGAILSLENGARLRLGSDTRLQVGDLGHDRPFRLISGKVFGLMPAHTGKPILLDGPDAKVQCSTGTFVYSVQDQASQLRVLSGDATVRARDLRLGVASAQIPAPASALRLGPGMLALTGPDIIDRTQSDVTVPVDKAQPDQDEQPPPPAPQAPAPLPPTPPPAVPPAPPPPPSSQVEEQQSGFNPLFLLLGLGGAGVLIGFLAGGGGTNNNIPVSP